MKANRTTVAVSVEFDGIHNWEEAPNFLKNPHQHRFQVKIQIETSPGDNSRSLEFFEVKSALTEAIEVAFPSQDDLGVRQLGGLSTEAISDRIDEALPQDLRGRQRRIGVYEDDTQGSESEYLGQSRESDEAVLFNQVEIESRVSQLASAISADYQDQEDLTVLCLLRGSFIFAADLVRKIDHPQLQVEFVQFSSYEGENRGELELVSYFPNLAGRNVLIVDDISDSGATLQRAVELAWSVGAQTVEAAVLLQRSSPQDLAIAKYFGFVLLGEEFVYGYGLDLDERERNLPFIRTKAS